MKNTFSNTDVNDFQGYLSDIMNDYVGYLDQPEVKAEVMGKFYNSINYTFSGMTKVEAYYYHNSLMDLYDTLMVSSEYFV